MHGMWGQVAPVPLCSWANPPPAWGKQLLGFFIWGKKALGGSSSMSKRFWGGSSSMSKQFWGVFHPSVLHGLGQAAGPIHANQGCQLHRSAKRVNYLTNVIFSLIAPHY